MLILAKFVYIFLCYIQIVQFLYFLILLLDLSIFRREQIWFTQLNEDRATDLYSLLEIKNVRKSENISKGYVDGKYGAVPMLNSSFAKNLESEI